MQILHRNMIVLVFFSLIALCHGYFTLPGKCPENVTLQEDFRLPEFFGKWYQVYHYSSDQQQLSNCSTLELMTRPTGIFLNITRIDRGLFQRSSAARLDIPVDVANTANLSLIFFFKDAPRRIRTRKYPFRVLATRNPYFATVYTCSYSQLIDKHYIYVWILSRRETLNEVSKELAIQPLRHIGVDPAKLVPDDHSNCSPKYYEPQETEPVNFRFPVPV